MLITLKKLHTLHIGGARLSEAGIERLVQALPNCRVVQ